MDPEADAQRCSLCGSILNDTENRGSNSAWTGRTESTCRDCVELARFIDENQDIVDYVKSLDFDELKQRTEAILRWLSDDDREVIERLHGLRDGFTYSAHEVAADCRISVEQVNDINDKFLASSKARGRK